MKILDFSTLGIAALLASAILATPSSAVARDAAGVYRQCRAIPCPPKESLP